MANAVELATGYVTLTVESKDVGKQIGRAFANGDSIASRAGKSMGQNMAKAFTKNQPDMDKLTDDVKLAEEKIAAHAERSATRQASAKSKVDIAQAKLNESYDRAYAKIQKENDLLSAQGKTRKLTSDEIDRQARSSSTYLTAVDRLSTSQQKLEAETLSAADAQRKLKQDLGTAKTALSDAASSSQKASTQYSKGWRGVGQRIKVQLTKGVRTASSAAATEAERGGKRAGGRFSGAFSGAFGGVLAGVTVGAVFREIGSMTNLAGAAEQSIGALDTVFKGNAEVMHQWAKSAKTAVGISSNEYRELGTLLGSQLKNMGTPMGELADKTNGLITMGADMASMFGGTTKQAIEAVSSALKGEMDPIEKYGITLNQATLEAEALSKGILKPVKDADAVNAAATRMQVAQSKYTEAVRKHGKDSDEAKTKQLALTAAEKAYTKATEGKVPKLDSESKALAVQSALYAQSADAQGNFMREEDTFEHKRQVALASWADLKETVGKAFLPAMTAAFGYIGSEAIPALERMVGWVKENQAWLKPLAVTVASAVGAFMLFRGVATAIFAVTKAVSAFKLGFAALNVVMKANVFVLIASLIAGLIVGFIYLWKTNEKFRGFFIGMWEGIKNAVGSAVEWIGGALRNMGDFFRDVWSGVESIVGGVVSFFRDTVAPMFVWFYESVIKPIWHGIKTAIAVAVTPIVAVAMLLVWTFKKFVAPVFVWLLNNIVKPVWNSLKKLTSNMWAGVKGIFKAIVNFVRTALSAAFTWFRDSVIKPVWAFILNTITRTWTGLKTIFWAIVNFLKTTLSNAFKWLYDKIIKPVWDGIKNTIRNVWNNGIKPIFQAFGNFIEDKVAPVFKKGVDKIKSIWDGIKEAAKKPIKFVIDTVINNGLIKAFNTVAGWIPGVDEIGPVSIPGFATGGYTGPGAKYQEAGVVHADEFVLRKEATNSLRKTIGLDGLDYMNKTGRMPGFAKGGLVKPIRSGTVTSRFGSPRGRYPHAGIDFAVPVGTPVYASMDGTVSRAGVNSVAGRTGIGAFLGHDGGRNTYYGHLSRLLVKVGDTIRAGQQIALSGNTGNSTGPHLHFETWTGGKPVNPEPYLGGAILPEGGVSGGGNPLQAILDFGSKLAGMFTDKFPAGGHLVDIVKGTGTKLTSGVKSWLSDKLAAIGDVGQDVWGNTKDFFNGKDSSVQSAVRGVADQYGWGTGRHWNALGKIISKESGWNPNAANPTSSARGLFQKMTSLHGPVEPTAEGQAKWGLNYIRERYGDPEKAWAYWKRNGSYSDGGLVTPTLYDTGGWLNTGVTTVTNKTNKPEAIYTSTQNNDLQTLADYARDKIESESDARGDTYNVVTPQGATVDDMVSALKFEKRRNQRGGKKS